ncbi:conjugal transfer protein TrbL family protein [Alkaliphilus oremlandii]|uniref:Uncharacterized protein n=1 Tax=Alkaliphilus oremlandii (strain OhILAs) TaxID=350688 RepID=A8MI18_ALKOO|nr:conjugal transfer protein TrbL family protein [Alkaliphilus oremlandii]ABW19450.1 hypothetical protein Clos_1910 [Alkaliphilus oremlandii OhILAs]
MTALFIGLLAAFIIGFLANSYWIENIVHLALYAEKYIADFGIGGFNFLFDIFLGYGISLIVLKFLKKGFDIYILWVDGDADADPIILLTNFFRAMTLAIGFPVIYEVVAKIVENATTEVLNAIGLNIENSSLGMLNDLMTIGIAPIILYSIFTVVFIYLNIQFVVRGLEILVLRTGIPLAATGLMDADKGVFKTYIQKFIQEFFTVLIQVVLAKLGLALMRNWNMQDYTAYFGIAAMILAVKTPRFLQEFIIVSSGGGGMNGIYSTARMAQITRSLFRG